MRTFGFGYGFDAAGTAKLRPPAGFVFLVDPDGFILTDPDGAYLLEAE